MVALEAQMDALRRKTSSSCDGGSKVPSSPNNGVGEEDAPRKDSEDSDPDSHAAHRSNSFVEPRGKSEGDAVQARAHAESQETLAVHGNSPASHPSGGNECPTEGSAQSGKKPQEERKKDAVSGGIVSGPGAKKTPTEAHEAANRDVSSARDDAHVAHVDGEALSKLEAKLEEYEDRIMELEEVCSIHVCVSVSVPVLVPVCLCVCMCVCVWGKLRE